MLKELDLPKGRDEHILLDEKIKLTGLKAKEAGIEKSVLFPFYGIH